MKANRFVLSGFLFLFTALVSQAAMSEVFSSYQGHENCNRMVGFATHSTFYPVGATCEVVLQLNPDRTDFGGATYGSFSLILYNQGNVYARYNGAYKLETNWNIYFNMKSYNYPVAGYNYPFGTVYSNAINLATALNSSTQLLPIRPAIDPVYN